MIKKRRKKRFLHLVNLWIINHFLCGQRFYKLKLFLLKRIGVTVGESVKIVGPLHFGNMVKLSIGNGTFINHHFYIEGNGNVSIGSNCDIAPFAVFLTGTHEIGDANRRAGKGKVLSISLGNGCWIGARSTLCGCRLGHGCVVGCNSCVMNDFDSNIVLYNEKAKERKRIA